MRAVIQRVSGASVAVGDDVVGRIGPGYLALICAEAGDTDADARYVADKVAGLRIFEDAGGKMNRSILDTGGSVLAVSQFTLAGDARKGRRPSFSNAARPEQAVPLLETVIALLRAHGIPVETGRFQAEMQVSLVNDGPVTILLDSKRVF